MNETSARAIFLKELTERHMITDDVLEHGAIGQRRVYELSEGDRFGPGRMFGVTIVIHNEDGSTERDFDNDMPFFSRTAAEDHIAALREKYA